MKQTAIIGIVIAIVVVVIIAAVALSGSHAPSGTGGNTSSSSTPTTTGNQSSGSQYTQVMSKSTAGALTGYSGSNATYNVTYMNASKAQAALNGGAAPPGVVANITGEWVMRYGGVGANVGIFQITIGSKAPQALYDAALDSAAQSGEKFNVTNATADGMTYSYISNSTNISNSTVHSLILLGYKGGYATFVTLAGNATATPQTVVADVAAGLS